MLWHFNALNLSHSVSCAFSLPPRPRPCFPLSVSSPQFGSYANVSSSSITIQVLASTCLADSLCPSGCLNRAVENGVGCGGSTASLPPPDVVLGLDLIQEQQSPLVDQYLVDLTSYPQVNLVPTVGTLGHYYHLRPVDYGFMGLTFNASILPQLLSMDEKKTKFEMLFDGPTPLAHQLVVVSPSMDTTGLNFLLWTVAWYGDISLGLNGYVDNSVYGDWRYFWWRLFKTNMSVVTDWTTAFNSFTASGNGVNLMASYGTDPAYQSCSGTGEIGSWVTRTQGNVVGWAQVETAAVINATRSNLVGKFLSWIQSTPFQVCGQMR